MPFQETNMQTALECWRELGRADDIGTAVQRMTERLAARLPLEMLCLRALCLEESRLTIEALGVFECADEVCFGARPLEDRTQLDQFLGWCALKQIAEVSLAQRNHPVSLSLPHSFEIPRSCLVGPLFDESGPMGALIAVGKEGQSFSEAHQGLFLDLLEPFSIGLASHLVKRKLLRAQRAMEADKDALLSRLGRQDITDTVVGADGGLSEVLEKVEQVARTDATVLILGETGTGKEVVARRIHALSRRAKGPMFRVNCGAIPPELVDSELFGHERGSFTGAVAARKGWFERADGGTLFLDEIAELPLAGQVRLLRVIQEGVLERVGGQSAVSVDVRIVAATNAPLHDLVRQGRFREDLWYRISVFPLRIPPLKERIEDIPSLAQHFAWRAGKRLGGAPLALSPDEIHLLVNYDWPGNVRELNAVIERAAILGDGKTLCVAAALGVSLRSPAAGTDLSNAPPPNEPRPQTNFLTLDELTRQHIEAALQKCGGQIEGSRGAGALLAINPHTLRARMRKLGIDWKRFRQT
jgi:transcriptional regulator with GAF, ATPase, and Fis domain